jgi:hypothetical protein
MRMILREGKKPLVDFFYTAMHRSIFLSQTHLSINAVPWGPP